MSASSRPTPGARRPWRSSGHDAASAPGVKRILRIALTLLAVGLLAILAAVLIPPFFRSETRLAVLPVFDYDALCVPPVAFLREDVEGFAPLADLLKRDARQAGPVLLSELQARPGMQSLLGPDLKSLAPRAKDVLILYLSAQGVSDDGVAYLLCSDFDSINPDAGRCKLGDVLRQILQCPAAVKLLVLDSGSVVSDPRLGMVVNQFPRLLEVEMQGLDDSTLWVLNSHDMLETSQHSSGLRRSCFGALVADGLDGRAETNGDGAIGLDELFDFVRGHTMNWVDQATGGRRHQTPRLLKAGSGLVAEAPANVPLLAVRRRSKPRSQQPAAPPAPASAGRLWRSPLVMMADPASAAAGPPATGPAENQAKAAAKASPPPDAADPAAGPANPAQAGPAKPAQAGPAKPAQAPVAPGAGSPPTAAAIAGGAPSVKALLERAWRLRDALEDRSRRDGWSPSDFAPHLWREFQELLLGYELRYRAGAAFDEKKLADDLQKNILPLAAMMDGEREPSDVSRATIAARLAGAWRRFRADESRASYEQPTAEAMQLKRAAELKNDLLMRSSYYVRWHSRSCLDADRGAALDENLLQLLSKLAAFISAWEAAAPMSGALAPGLQPLSAQHTLQALGEQQRALSELRTAIDGVLSNEVSLVVQAPLRPGAASRIEDLLSTPLPTAGQRSQLMDALARIEPLAFEDAKGASVPQGGRESVGRPQWRRLCALAELDVALVRLAGADAADVLRAEQALKPLVGADQTSRAQIDAGAWNALSKLDQILEQFHRGLAGQAQARRDEAQRLTGNSRLATQLGAERLLRLVDARDARRIEDQVAIAPLPIRPRVQLAIDAPDRATIPADVDGALEVRLLAADGLPKGTRLTLDYDAALLEVRSSEDRSIIGPQTPRELAASSVADERTGALTYRLRSKAEGIGTTPLKLTVEAAGQVFSRSVLVDWGATERVDLIVEGPPGTVVAGSAVATAKQAACWQAFPFPNTVTSFRLALVNRSGRERKVKFELFRATAASPGSARGATRVADVPVEPPDFEPVTTLQDIALPAGPAPVPLPFPPPGATTPPPSGATTPPPPGATAPPPPGAALVEAEKAAAKRRIPMRGALVAVVSDVAHPEQRHITWLDCAVQPPSNYLEAEAAYDRAQGRLTINVQPRDNDGAGRPDTRRLPKSGSRVRWEIGDEIDPSAAMQTEGTIGPGQSQAQLFADVPPDSRRNVTVRLTVDDYPRAFVCRVNCGQTAWHIRPLRDLRQVKIVSPRNGQVFRAPLESLPVVLQVDAPTDAFRDPEAGDALEVGLNSTLDRTLPSAQARRFFGDRQLDLWLDELGPAGLLKIEAQVHDFQIDLAARGLKNTMVEVVAQLTIGAKEPEKDYIQVALDGAAPRIEVAVEPSSARVVAGQDMTLVIKAADLSGVKKVECGFDLDNSGKIAKPEPGVLDPQSGFWRVLLATKDIKPGRYTLLTRATDNVDLTCDPVRTSVTVVPVFQLRPGEPPAAEQRPVSPNNSLAGQALLSGQPVPRITVSLKGAGNPSTQTDHNGTFTFRDVPPGKYQVVAKGTAKNRLLEAGPTDVTVEPAPKPPASVTLEMR